MWIRYDANPTQDTLLRAISISRRWSVPALYNYAYDHFKRQFEGGHIHPAIVLGVAREYGIPDLIRPAVEALASPKRTFSSWSTNPTITCHTSVMDLGFIGRMKEKLLLARVTLCTPPPIFHNEVCTAKGRAACLASWESFWTSKIAPELLKTGGDATSRLWYIHNQVESAKVPGMGQGCAEQTITNVIAKPGWNAEWNIPDGAVNALMVPEHVMLTPGDASGDVMMAE